ncbi:hypothetical protein GCM10028808_43500 [Spirosoma migulaei]
MLLHSLIPNEASLGCEQLQTDETIFVNQIRSQKPDFALLTSEYAEQPGLFAQLRRSSPTTRIMLCVLPNAPKPGVLWPLLEALDVDVVCLLSELNKCLQTVSNGHFYVSALLATHSVSTTKAPFPGWHELTQCERRVLRLLAEGKSGPQIAGILFISPKTVDNHKYKISQKLNVSAGPGSLVKFALLNREKILAAPELTYTK